MDVTSEFEWSGFGGCRVLSLQFEVSLCCLHFVGAELVDSFAVEAREVGEPSFVDRCNPCCDWRCAWGHMAEIDECCDCFVMTLFALQNGRCVGAMEDDSWVSCTNFALTVCARSAS